jgi:hypothetical protein
VAVDYRLTSHEVMLGLKLRDGRLVIRQSGGVIAWSIIRLGFGWVLVVLGFGAGAVGWVLVPYGAWFAIDGLLWTRCRVVLSPDGVRVTNRFRRRQVDLDDFDVRVVTQRRWFPVLPQSTFSWYPPYEFGEAFLDDGIRLRLDALVGIPGDRAPDPSPVATKVAALERYRESVR